MTSYNAMFLAYRQMEQDFPKYASLEYAECIHCNQTLKRRQGDVPSLLYPHGEEHVSSTKLQQKVRPFY